MKQLQKGMERLKRRNLFKRALRYELHVDTDIQPVNKPALVR